MFTVSRKFGVSLSLSRRALSGPRGANKGLARGIPERIVIAGARRPFPRECEPSLTRYSARLLKARCVRASSALYITSLRTPLSFSLSLCACTSRARVHVRVSSGRDGRRLLRGRSCSFNGPRVPAVLSVGSTSRSTLPFSPSVRRVRRRRRRRLLVHDRR